ncbi:MAG: Sec-independent protein translocase protein TatB [Lysobacteraceae bacterium]
MFELGWIEIGLIGVIALVVLGPERLPKAARLAGLWVRKARAQWFAMKAELEREIAAEELKASVAGVRRDLQDAADRVREDLRGMDASLREGLRDDPPSADASAPSAGPSPSAPARPDAAPPVP